MTLRETVYFMGCVVFTLSNNDSLVCLYITIYLAVMLRGSWHTAEGN